MAVVPSDERADVDGGAAVRRTRRATWVRGRVRVVVPAVLVLVGLAGVSSYVRWAYGRLQAKRALTRALGDYAECMLGAQLAPGETATARLRRIEAGLPERTVAPAQTSPESAWPLRCRADLDHAHMALTHPAFARDPAAARLDAVVLRARTDPSPADAPDLVDQLLVAASQAGSPAVPRRFPAPGLHVAPPPATPLTAESLAPLPVRVRSAPDELPGGETGTLRLSFFDPRAPAWTCAFAPLHGEPLREARCGEVRPGVVSVTRDEVPRGPGTLRTQRGRFDRFELLRPVPGGDPDLTALPYSIQTVGLFGDQLVWVTSHRWYAQTVPPGRAPLGPPVDLGEVAGASPELQTCQTATALVVGVKTFDAALDDRRSWRAMAAREAGGWKRTPGRAVVDVAATLTCQGHAGTWTWFDRHVVTQVRCNADRCETQASERMTLPWDVGGALYAADLGGRALVLGLGTTPGPLTGRSVASVRMRMAPLAALASAADVVLFSDAAHDGAPVADVAVFARDGVALILLAGDDPLPYRVIRLDALGNFAPVTPVN